MHLIEDLLLAVADRERASGAVELGEERFSGFGDFGDRKAEAVKVGHIFVAWVGEIAAGELPRALQQVADGSSLAETIPVVQRPAELMHHRREEERWVRNAPGNDDVRATAQAIENRFDAKIGIRRDKEFAGVIGRMSREEM